MQQLPRSQPRALQEWPRLIRIDVNRVAILDRRANHAKRCTVAAGRQRSGVAVRQHAAITRQQFGAMSSQCAARCDIFVVHQLRFRDHRGAQRIYGRAWFGRQFEIVAAHALDGPEKIHRRRPRRCQHATDDFKLCRQRMDRGRRTLLQPQSHSHRSRHADGRRTAHHHRHNHVRDLLIRGCEYVSFFKRQARLVQKPDAVFGPFKGQNHGSFQSNDFQEFPLFGVLLRIRTSDGSPDEIASFHDPQ